MIRTTPGLQESIAKGWPRTMLAEIDHPAGEILRLWDGVGDLSYDGYTWKGINPFGRVVGIGGSKRLLIRSVTFLLSGIPANQTVYLDPRLRNRPAKAWLAGLDERGVKVNGEAFMEVNGLCDYQEHKVDDNGGQLIYMTVAEPVYSIERAQSLSYTPEWINSYLRRWRDRNLGGERITGLDRLSELANATRSWTRT
jgi:hypothetical protein